MAWRTGFGLEEVAEFLFVFGGGGWVPGDVGWFTFEEVGDVDAVFPVLVGCGEDVGSLEGLGEEAEDVFIISLEYVNRVQGKCIP